MPALRPLRPDVPSEPREVRRHYRRHWFWWEVLLASGLSSILWVFEPPNVASALITEIPGIAGKRQLMAPSAGRVNLSCTPSPVVDKRPVRRTVR